MSELTLIPRSEMKHIMGGKLNPYNCVETLPGGGTRPVVIWSTNVDAAQGAADYLAWSNDNSGGIDCPGAE